MQGQNLLVVIGATGVQGGSVISTFLNEPQWQIRGVTRDLASSRSQELLARGVEMVVADLDDVDSLLRAFSGATAIFAVTDFWKPREDPGLGKWLQPGKLLSRAMYEYELQQGKNIFDVASGINGLDRLIFSGIADVAEATGGKYTNVYHSDTKTHAERYCKETYPELWRRVSVIQVGFYLSNWLENASMVPEVSSDGSVNFVSQFSEHTALPLIAADEDTGPLTRALLLEKPQTKLMGYRAWMTMGEFIAAWSKLLGRKVKLTTLPIADFLDAKGGPLEPDVKEMLAKGMAYLDEFGETLKTDPGMLQPKDLRSMTALGTVDDWIGKQDWSSILHAPSLGSTDDTSEAS